MSFNRNSLSTTFHHLPATTTTPNSSEILVSFLSICVPFQTLSSLQRVCENPHDDLLQGISAAVRAWADKTRAAVRCYGRLVGPRPRLRPTPYSIHSGRQRHLRSRFRTLAPSRLLPRLRPALYRRTNSTSLSTLKELSFVKETICVHAMHAKLVKVRARSSTARDALPDQTLALV